MRKIISNSPRLATIRFIIYNTHMSNIAKTKQLIACINAVHLLFSQDYFETGQVEKINLSRTQVPTAHMLRYRLILHESINDYLLTQNLDNITYYYRVKTAEAITDKVARYAGRENQYPANNWMNDIFGARMILSAADLALVQNELDHWRDTFNLKNWYMRDKDDYRGLHIYFKNKSNFYFPWELQLWDTADIDKNIQNHRLLKRKFIHQ